LGNMIIEKDDGWYSLLAALSSHEPQLFIGLNSNNPHIQERLDQEPQKKEKIYIYISSHSDHFNKNQVHDQIERMLNVTKVPFEVIQLPEIPINPDGSVDFDLLHQRCHEEVRINLAGEVPQTDAEKRIVAIWKEVLNLERVGIHDNFFDLGGNSLSMSQVNGRLQEEFGSNISMTEMFQYSTISSLAEYLIESPADTVSQRLKQGQDRGSRRREQMQYRKHR
jgi:acyl carrier protein